MCSQNVLLDRFCWDHERGTSKQPLCFFPSGSVRLLGTQKERVIETDIFYIKLVDLLPKKNRLDIFNDIISFTSFIEKKYLSHFFH